MTVTIEDRKKWRKDFEFPALLGEKNAPIIIKLLDALDDADARIAQINEDALNACLALGRQIGMIELAAETWSARATEAEALLPDPIVGPT